MDLPSLDDRVMARMKKLHLSFTQACHSPELELIVQSKAFMFLEDFNASLTPAVRQVMGLE